MFVIALCTAYFCRTKISKKKFGPPTLNTLAPTLRREQYLKGITSGFVFFRATSHFLGHISHGSKKSILSSIYM